MNKVPFWVIVLCYGSFREVFGDNLPTCLPKDFHYELTECDDAGGRWRVSVPSPGECTGGAPNAPVRIDTCALECKPGYSYDLDTLTCRKCPKGTYSLGNAISIESWPVDKLLYGFRSEVEPFASRSVFMNLERQRASYNCSRSGWQGKGEYIAFPGGPCVATLSMSVKLVRSGALTYTYQYPDDDVIFQFQAQNDVCQGEVQSEEFKWPTVTEAGAWASKTIPLPAGDHLLQWKAVGISARQTKPILVKHVQITGVAASNGCIPCSTGTHSAEGAEVCSPCAANHYPSSTKDECLSCDTTTEYSRAGDEKCSLKPPCTVQDYYEVRSPCDALNQTRVKYRWLEPRICRDDISGAVQLPLDASRICPPCNPGMTLNGNTGKCDWCPPGWRSSGGGVCAPCPPNTSPNTGLQLIWWQQLPSFVTVKCMTLDGAGCGTGQAWISGPGGSHVRTGLGHAPMVYLVLSVAVEKGFRAPSYGGPSNALGQVSFSFELDCQAECEFVFMQGSPSKGVSVIHSWTGRQPRQSYVFDVLRNDSYTFSWAFQKLPWDQDNQDERNREHGRSGMKLYENDVARLFSINITNTVEGGASTCLPCLRGSSRTGHCIGCTAGEVIDKQTGKCVKCPAHTVVGVTADGSTGCVSCGPGLLSLDGQTCVSDCQPNIDGVQYDLRGIGSTPRDVPGSLLFTASGLQYSHVFNVSLCGSKPVSCTNNLTAPMPGVPETSDVEALICRSTLIPSTGMGPGNGPLSTQAVSLGDELLAVTSTPSFGNVSIPQAFLSKEKQLYFFYAASASSRSCPEGRTTSITLRCDADAAGTGLIELPPNCPDGTCDGCHFHFLWNTPHACPLCGHKDVRVVKSECSNGQQTVHYLAGKGCRMRPSDQKHVTVACKEHIPLVLQLVSVGCVVVALLLCFLVLYCWKQQQRLEYKYMKLVQRSEASRSRVPHAPLGHDNDAECEDHDAALPGAESCGLQEGEDEGEGEEVSITVPIRGHAHSIVEKIKSFTSKGDMNSFETINLTGKSQLMT